MADNESLFCGYDNDTHRLTYCNEQNLADPTNLYYAAEARYARAKKTTIASAAPTPAASTWPSATARSSS